MLEENHNYVTVVTVTYGNRVHLLEQVVDSCYVEGVDRIIIVANGVTDDVVTVLDKLVGKSRVPVRLELLEENIGSAGGFSKGLRIFSDEVGEGCVWLLDDDNVPACGSLSELKAFGRKLAGLDGGSECSALLSYRPDRQMYAQAVLEGDESIVIGPVDGFLGFSIFDRLKYSKRHLDLSKFDGNGSVAVAPYGGLFLTCSSLNRVGLPDERFYLYVDDHEWTYRLRKLGKILLVGSSRVEDVEQSWNVHEENWNFVKRLSKAPAFRLYYSTRNRVYFELNFLVNSRVRYYLNVICVSMLFVAYSVLRPRLLTVWFSALKDGFEGNLGVSRMKLGD
ncbi:glycosyltransferase [Pelagicoccus albus]|uniref:Glycosyltransferase n=1 Tax=Pelagicoccus albus TaxID=415222 RepID=A0A7X1B8E8_9BACT|nr:glycosyltransferase [Pelagicoccus albus]MBC2606285.1 glycosyltransferase [Pelagicoccus albus]